jgi:hypothetical protein
LVATVYARSPARKPPVGMEDKNAGEKMDVSTFEGPGETAGMAKVYRLHATPSLSLRCHHCMLRSYTA